MEGSTFRGIAPSEDAPAIWRAMVCTIGPGMSIPRRLISLMEYRASPARSTASVPAILSGSRGPNMPANGPSVPGGRARVSRRACRTSVPSCNSTRSESYILRTLQSMPEPISDATSFGVKMTESGPAFVSSLPTFSFPDAVARGVGAPTAVSATDGSAVERPNQCANVCMIGARNHHTSASAQMSTAAQPSRTIPLRQPFMVFHLIHRGGALWLERAFHQIDVRNRNGLREINRVEQLLEPVEIARSRIALRSTQGHVRPKGARLGRKAQRGERLLHAMLQQLERRIRGHAGPHDVWPAIIGKDAESFDVQCEWTRLRACVSARGLPQGGVQLRLASLVDVTKKLETHVNVFGTDPFDGKGCFALPQRRERLPELAADGFRKIQGDEGSNRLPRREPRGSI